MYKSSFVVSGYKNDYKKIFFVIQVLRVFFCVIDKALK